MSQSTAFSAFKKGKLLSVSDFASGSFSDQIHGKKNRSSSENPISIRTSLRYPGSYFVNGLRFVPNGIVVWVERNEYGNPVAKASKNFYISLESIMAYLFKFEIVSFEQLSNPDLSVFEALSKQQIKTPFLF
ncbi:hypothetical protein [Methylomonas sp. AM2-LC]|uniref:hypothetical protein n=1 Tax=Methylomonas sp. AM2-LC TaxID=3153301 RepID=UPI0032671118